MAKKSKQQASNGTKPVNGDYAIPEGFTIKVGRERGDGWVKKEEGNVVQGRLLGRHTYEQRGKKRAYYQIQLHAPCVCEVENPDYDDENEDEMEEKGIEPRMMAKLEEGAIVNVDESTKLEDLEARAKDGGVYDVWFVYGKKVDLDGGRSMWSVTGPYLKMVEKPSEIPF